MARELCGMVCLITGASSGIGAALAVELGKAGAKLVLGARRMERLEEVNRLAGGGHLCVRMDVAKEEECRALVEAAVGRFGRIDTLVCNAGYGIVAPVEQTSAEQFRQIFQVNLFGTVDCVRYAVPVMKGQGGRRAKFEARNSNDESNSKFEASNGARGGGARDAAPGTPHLRWRGQIVIVSSGLARRAAPTAGAYSATKAAQLSVAEALRVSLRPAGIAVTSVHPVLTETEFFEVAEREGGKRMPARSRWEVYQSAERVAKKIVAAIRRPRAEVWPYRPARWAAIVGIMFPRLGDWVMAQHRKSLLRDSTRRREGAKKIEPRRTRRHETTDEHG